MRRSRSSTTTSGKPEHGLCRGELDEGWTPTESYRGQNANMHMCEAFTAAYEATDDDAHLDRTYTIAETLAGDLTDAGDGVLWEHYAEEWEHDWTYNEDEPIHLFRLWDYQPGHLAKWTKLLCCLAEHREEGWLVERVQQFFDAATEHGWDDE